MFTIDEGKLFFGAAINFNNICWVYPLTIKEIIGMGQDTYNEYISYLCADIAETQELMKKDGVPDEQLPNTAFDYLMQQSKSNSIFFVSYKKLFLLLFEKKFIFYMNKM